MVNLKLATRPSYKLVENGAFVAFLSQAAVRYKCRRLPVYLSLGQLERRPVGKIVDMIDGA